MGIPEDITTTAEDMTFIPLSSASLRSYTHALHSGGDAIGK